MQNRVRSFLALVHYSFVNNLAGQIHGCASPGTIQMMCVWACLREHPRDRLVQGSLGEQLSVCVLQQQIPLSLQLFLHLFVCCLQLGNVTLAVAKGKPDTDTTTSAIQLTRARTHQLLSKFVFRGGMRAQGSNVGRNAASIWKRWICTKLKQGCHCDAVANLNRQRQCGQFSSRKTTAITNIPLLGCALDVIPKQPVKSSLV
jgi:hypothetical protein